MSNTNLWFLRTVAEHSHRSALAADIINQAKADLAACLDIPDDYEILFMQGGGTVCDFFLSQISNTNVKLPGTILCCSL